MIERFGQNWLAKVGALVLACFLWYFVSTSENTIASSEFQVPVIYDGLEADQIARGAPASVLVRVIGQKDQLNRLTENNFSAIIDFSDTTGTYEKDISVVQPEGITVASITPATALGTVETIETKEVTIQPSLLGLAPEDQQVSITLQRTEVNVLGFSSSLERVTQVVANILPREGTQVVTLFPADASNIPIKDSTMTVSPATVSVIVRFNASLSEKEVKLNLSELTDSLNFETLGLSRLSLEKDTISVVGPKAVLDSLEEVFVTVEPITGELTAGTYTMKMIPRLPDGVTALNDVFVEIDFVALETLEPDDSEIVPDEPDGENNDTTSTPVRGPSTKEKSFFGRLF